MTEITINLPDELAQRARQAGLLTNATIERLLEDAMQRDSKNQLHAAIKQLRDAPGEYMSEEEVMQQVYAYRAERRAPTNKPPSPNAS
jgi:predicted transcriptional regulator